VDPNSQREEHGRSIPAASFVAIFFSNRVPPSDWRKKQRHTGTQQHEEDAPTTWGGSSSFSSEDTDPLNVCMMGSPDSKPNLEPRFAAYSPELARAQAPHRSSLQVSGPGERGGADVGGSRRREEAGGAGRRDSGGDGGRHAVGIPFVLTVFALLGWSWHVHVMVMDADLLRKQGTFFLGFVSGRLPSHDCTHNLIITPNFLSQAFGYPNVAVFQVDIVVFHVLFLCEVISYLRIIGTSPGYVPRGWPNNSSSSSSSSSNNNSSNNNNNNNNNKITAAADREQGCEMATLGQATNEPADPARFCEKCQCKKPERSHHCRVCQRCVLKMDHHCPVGVPVSIGNPTRTVRAKRTASASCVSPMGSRRQHVLPTRFITQT